MEIVKYFFVNFISWCGASVGKIYSNYVFRLILGTLAPDHNSSEFKKIKNLRLDGLRIRSENLQMNFQIKNIYSKIKCIK